MHGPVPQGDFLRALGIEARAGALRARASEAEAAAVRSALARLTDDAPRGMGGLFKAMAISHPHLIALPGFSPLPAP